MSTSSQIFPPRSSDPGPEHRAPYLHVDLVEGAHDGLDVVVIYLVEETPDGLLGLGTGRVGADGGRAARSGAPGRGCW